MHLRTGAGVTALMLTCAVGLAGCGGPETPTDSRPSVVTSTDVYGAVASAVAGDRATVHPIIDGPNRDPHEYENTPSDALAVGRAAVFVVNGGGYDDFAGRLLDAASTKPSVINVVELSGLNATAPEFNEHVWYHLPTVARLADRLAGELGRVHPADAATFTANAVAFKTRLAGLSTKLTAIQATHAGDRVAVTEPLPAYLIEAAGLRDATPPALPRAVESGSDAPAAVLNEALRLFDPSNAPGPVKALLVNGQTRGATTEQLERAAHGVGVPVLTVTETLPPGTTDYIAWMGDQVDRLSAALAKPVPGSGR